MAIQSASAKLFTGIRCWCVDKNISASLTSSFSIGNYNRPIQPIGQNVLYSNCLAQRLIRFVCDTEPTASITLTDERYKTYGGGNVVNDGYFVVGESYKILDLGDSDWDAISGEKRDSWNLGDEFTAQNNGTVPYLSPPVEENAVDDKRSPIPKTGKAHLSSWTVRGSLVCKFPTYIRIDIEKLGLPEGVDCLVEFEEGWITEGDYPGSTYAPSPEVRNFFQFRTPYYGVGFLRPAFTLYQQPLRIKQLQSSIISVGSITRAYPIFNPGKFAAIFGGVFLTTPNASKKVVSGSNMYASFGPNNVGGMPEFNFPYRVKLFNSTFDTSMFSTNIDGKKLVGYSIPLSSQSSISASYNKFIGTITNLSSSYSLINNNIRTRDVGISINSQFANMSIIGSIEQNTINMSSSFTTYAKGNYAIANSTSTITAQSSQTTRINYRAKGSSTISAVSTCEQGFDFVAAISVNANHLASIFVGSATIPNPGLIEFSTPSTVYNSGNYTIYWGDGSSNSYSGTNTATHTYSKAGTYYLKIRGDAAAILGPIEKISRLFAFGENIKQVSYVFHGSTINPEVPDIMPSNVKSIAGLFYNAQSFNRNINSWDVSNISAFSDTFYDCKMFDQPLNSWNTSSAISMNQMFYGAGRFNQSIDSWDVSNVETFQGMFGGGEYITATGHWMLFNQSLNSWNTGSAIDMTNMFNLSDSFNSAIGSWDVSKVKYFNRMFFSTRFAQDISTWTPISAVDMSYMFYGQRFNAWTYSLNGWNVSSVTNMSYMFADSTTSNPDVSSWNVSNVTNMEGMFMTNSQFNRDISGWDVSNVTNMSKMFQQSFTNYSPFNQDLSSWCVSQFPTKPALFDTNANLWTAPKPVWGTCPA